MPTASARDPRMAARVGVIDDHPAVILGTSSILNQQPGLQVVATGATAQELMLQRIRLDVILLDLVLADGSTPTDNLHRLAVFQAPVIAYTAGDRPHLVREAIAAGAAGMIRKSDLPTALVAAVETVLAGGVATSADWASALDGDEGFVRAQLTAREAEVLALYASGETAERVAALLYISKETVYDHVRRIRAKYAALDRPSHTKVELYRRAVEDGIVPPER
jgi:DNA-binding NarL/FixJ family response regulator